MMLWQHTANYDPLDDTAVIAETITVTVPSATVGSDLTDFPLFIDLSGMPAAFWAAVSPTAGNIRAYVGAQRLPIDIVAFEPVNEDGAIFVKVPTIASGSDTDIDIVLLEDLATERQFPGASYGQQAVWVDYEAVFLGGETYNNRATGALVTCANEPDLLTITGTVFTMTTDPHQGIAYDPSTTDWYAVDNNALYRYNSSGTLQTSNTDPSGDVETDHSIGTLGHCCAPCLCGSYLVVPINNYPTQNAAYLALFDKTTLAYVDSIEISYPRISGVCYNNEEDRLVACEWDGFDRLIKYSLSGSTLSFDTTVTLTKTGANTVNEIQDIEYWRAANCYVVVDDNRDAMLRVELDGSINVVNTFGNANADSSAVSGNMEGLCAYNDGLAVLIDPSAANSFIQAYNYSDVGHAKYGVDFEATNAYINMTNLSGGTTWTIGATVVNDTTSQSSILSWRDASAGSTNDRASLVLDDISGTRYMNVWDDSNSWISTSSGSLVSVAQNVYARGHAVYEGTTQRKLYTNGALTVTDSVITAQDVDYDMLSLALEDETGAERLKGRIGFAYLRLSALSADWIAAEYDMLTDNASFVVKPV